MSPLYVYGCKDIDHPTKEVRHGIEEVIQTLFCDICGQPMHRIPQAFRLNVPPADSGQRNAKEIHGYLKSKWKANKERREANEYEKRKAQERK